MCLVEGAVGCQGNIALRRQHDFHLHTTTDSLCQCFCHRGYQREVGIDDVDGVLGLIDGIDIECAHDFRRHMRFAIDDAHHLRALRAGGVRLQAFEDCRSSATIVFHAADVFTSRTIPNAEEDGLQFVDGITLDTAVHIAPFAYLLSAFDVVVGYIHATRVGYLSVDDHDFAVVASENVVDPRKSDGGVLHDVDTILAQ